MDINLSVIIPIGPEDYSWKYLLNDLRKLPDKSELIFVCCYQLSESDRKLFKDLRARYSVELLNSKPSRALQMNLGAARATGNFFWFIHSDTKFQKNTVEALLKSVGNWPGDIHYFNLHFLNDGPNLMKVNELGVYLRSHVFGLPFGDQALAISSETFKKLEGFPIVSQGEDHSFVWHARQQGVNIRCCNASVHTSSRKYADGKWLTSTINTLVLTIRQAMRELPGYIKSKVGL